ncbi:MAG: hypothetical protein RSI33_11695, partial [Clostridia bacterium]
KGHQKLFHGLVSSLFGYILSAGTTPDRWFSLSDTVAILPNHYTLVSPLCKGLLRMTRGKKQSKNQKKKGAAVTGASPFDSTPAE